MISEKLEEAGGDSLLNLLLKSMKRLVKEENEVVFQYGDQGSLFYIILKGEVGVKVPTEHNLTLSDSEYVDYLIRNYDDIDFDKTEVPQEMLDIVHKWIKEDEAKAITSSQKSI